MVSALVPWLHHRYAPNVHFSGGYQGAWFKVIQEKYLSELTLHYKWAVHFDNPSGSCITAEGAERWDMNLIYQDIVQMAMVLQKHAREIRALKNDSFKRNKEMKEVASHLLLARNYDGLVEWMKTKVENKFAAYY